MFALERGIEATYELEDSELNSELLPPKDGPRDRMLFTEAAEGGAGVLRQLQSERFDLAGVAAAALEICHFDPRRHRPGRPASRPAVCAGLLRLPADLRQPAPPRRDRPAPRARPAAAPGRGPATLATGRGETRSEQFARLTQQVGHRAGGPVPRVAEGARPAPARRGADRRSRRRGATRLRLPAARRQRRGLRRRSGARVRRRRRTRDIEAEERLLDLGWDVVRFPHDVDWSAIAARHERYFGAGARN